ncbi:MAG: hypothetical protein JKY37_05185 [Nannocystaceae bacterium]|nr:hypothetical protein [Nannocystaceae bacterium]
MAISSLTCPPPVRRTTRTTHPDFESLDAAIKLYREGHHAQSLARTFEHLFPDLDVPELSPELAMEEFCFGQGSSRVSVSIEDGSLHVRVPLVRLAPQSLTTAALRFVLSRISATGQLYQPRLRGEDIVLEFTDRITRLHPHKVREVLREMPVEADANDDWMVTEFECTPLGREPIEALTEDEYKRAQNIWTTHWLEVDELVKVSQRSRSMFFLNEITAYAVHHIQHAVPLTGYWWSRISAAADTFNDSNCDPTTREAALTKCAKEMQAVSTESLRDSLGHARYTISPHADGTTKVLSVNLGSGDYLDMVMRLHNGGRYAESALGLISTYNYLLARFSWSPEIETMLLEGLARASGTPWRDAAAALLEHGETIIAAVKLSDAEAASDGKAASDGNDKAESDAPPNSDAKKANS